MVPRARKTGILVSAPFCAAVALLLLNDFVLKSVAPGLITGKLSDFAGLFALGLFLLVILPAPSEVVLLGLAALFVFWKSAWSTPVIAHWNALGVFRIGRIIDPDLVALIALPFCQFFHARVKPAAVSRWALPNDERDLPFRLHRHQSPDERGGGRSLQCKSGDL